MSVKRLSVFIENREERLEQVIEVLKEENIDTLSLSMADTTEYGILRMIVPDSEEARNGLREKGPSAIPTDVLAVKLEDHVGEFHRMTYTLCDQGLNIGYMYALASANRRAMIVKTSDDETTAKATTDGGLVLYNDEEMC